LNTRNLKSDHLHEKMSRHVRRRNTELFRQRVYGLAFLLRKPNAQRCGARWFFGWQTEWGRVAHNILLIRITSLLHSVMRDVRTTQNNDGEMMGRLWVTKRQAGKMRDGHGRIAERNQKGYCL